jgi:hypothetical protein
MMSEGYCHLERANCTGICILLLVYLTISVARIMVSIQCIWKNTSGNCLDLLCGSIRTASEETGEYHKKISAKTGNIRDGVWSSKQPNTKQQCCQLDGEIRDDRYNFLLQTTYTSFALVCMLFTKVLVTSTVWQMALLIRRTRHVPNFIP